MCGAGHEFMRGVIIATRVTDAMLIDDRSRCAWHCDRLLALPGRCRWRAPASRTAPRAGAGRAARRRHAGRVRGVPARPRRLPRGRDRGRRPGPGVQRHELRRLPQRAGDRRRRARSPKCAPGDADRDGEFIALDAVRRDAVPPVLGPQPRLPAGRFPPRPTSSRGACRFRCSAPAWSRRSPTRRCSRSKIRSIATATASAAARRIVTDRRDRRAARRPLRLEGAARDAARVRRRRLSQRDGHHQRPLPAGGRRRHLAGAHARRAIRFPIPRTSRDPRTRRRGIDNFASFMKFLAPVGARRRSTRRRATASRCSARSAARRATCRR